MSNDTDTESPSHWAKAVAEQGCGEPKKVRFMTLKLRASPRICPMPACCLSQDVGSFAPPPANSVGRSPRRGIDVATIVTALKTWSQEELAQRMKLSATLAEKVHRWHQGGSPIPTTAGWTFKGDAFKSLDLASASEEVVRRAQSRLRIVDAVYGLLRPLDQYAPVRLEMATIADG